MRSLTRIALLIALVAGGVAALAAPASAAQTSNSEIVIIREGDVVSDDLYAGAIRVVVEGRIEGDLIAFAAEEVVVNGSVGGSVMAVTPTVIVNGEISGALRTAASSVVVTGDLGGDLVATGLDVELTSESVVSGEVLAWVWDMRSLGQVGALGGAQRTLELGGSVDGDVDVSVGELRVVEPLTVGGDLGFRSENEAVGIDQASVGGVIVDKAPLPPNIRVRGLILLARLLVALLLAIAALTVTWGWPSETLSAVEAVGRAPIRSWAAGAPVVFSPLILIGVAALVVVLAPAAASFPLVVVLAPLVLAAFGLVGALSLVAGIPVVGWLGSRLVPRRSVYAAVLAGSGALGLLWFLPVLAWIIPVVTLPLGLGAWLRARRVD